MPMDGKGALTAITADVCLIIEGAYPYVRGGVSSWVHDLIASQCHLRFHLLVIAAPDADLTLRYDLPPNVSGLSHIFVQQMPDGAGTLRGQNQLIAKLHAPVSRLLSSGSADDVRELVQLLAPYRKRIGKRVLLDSKGAWASYNKLYLAMCEDASYLNAFWGWRTLVAGLYSMLLAELPNAYIYHAISTGYAGLLLCRAAIETGCPTLVTEHGIYTNERRLEILAASWLAVDDSKAFSIDDVGNKVKELWVNTFVSYSKACYETSTQIITLFEGNYPLQLEDGAQPERLSVIPNGIDLDRYKDIVRVPRRAEGGTRPPTIALIGRVVPIKDIKTFIRSCALLVQRIPDLVCYILGPMDEDEDYALSCKDLVKQVDGQDQIKFMGMVNLMEYFGQIDVIVLTSISESQPLVILEGGAASVPSVATNVGSCSELIMGRSDESPRLGVGGRIAAIGDPAAIADAIGELLLDEELRRACGEVMRERVRQHYDKQSLHVRYAKLYEGLVEDAKAHLREGR